MTDVKLSPAHETVLGLIARSDAEGLPNVGNFIKATYFPKGHDLIASKWTERWSFLTGAVDNTGVVDSLLGQKEKTEEVKDEPPSIQPTAEVDVRWEREEIPF